MPFRPYHRFANRRKLERIISSLNDTKNITDEAFSNFHRYHPAMLHKLRAAQSNLVALTDKLTTIDIREAAVTTGDFLQKSAGDWVDFDLFDSGNTWTQDQTLSSSNKLILRDADIFIHSPSNGIMTLDSDISLKLNINGTEIGSFTGGLLQGLIVNGDVTADGIRVEGDSGGSGSRVTLTNVSVSPGFGGKASLGKVVSLGSGPTSTGQSKWLKIYDGLTDYWIPIWT